MKHLTEYSEHLGLSKAYLGVYRTNRGFPKKTKPSIIYEAYKAELKQQAETRERLQSLFYELEETRGATIEFARYLVDKGIIVSENSLRAILDHSFKNLDSRLIGTQYTQRHIDILKAYEEWTTIVTGKQIGRAHV